MPRRTTTFGTSNTPTKSPSNGHFSKGQWHCNCQPRLPAVQFQVRRESTNKGRWFYTCQVDRTKGKSGEPTRCDFFLWADDARLREEAAVLSNSTTEPGASTQPNGKAGDGNKKSLRSPRKLVQTTLSARVEPRAEGRRHWTHRTEITPIDELERAVTGSQKDGEVHQEKLDNEDNVTASRTSGNGNGSGKGKTSANLKATYTSDSKTVASTSTHTGHHDFGGSDMDVETDDEDELGRVTDSATKPVPTTASKSKQQSQTPSAGSKRKREMFLLDDDDDDLFGDMDSEEERQLAAITDSSSRPSRTRDAFVTPAAPRSTDVAAGMPTPSLTSKSVRRVLFAEPDVGEPSNNKRQRNNDAGAYSPAGAPTTPSSSQEAGGSLSAPMTPGSGSGIGNITEEVMDLLKGQNIDDQVIRRVKDTLQKYAAKAKGLEKGREVSRQAVKTQDAKIAHLQMRIADLENKRRLDIEAKRDMKSQLLRIYTQT
ncbi:hypothetical protein AB5N19_07497 [Seiridium cardinale]